MHGVGARHDGDARERQDATRIVTAGAPKLTVCWGRHEGRQRAARPRPWESRGGPALEPHVRTSPEAPRPALSQTPPRPSPAPLFSRSSSFVGNSSASTIALVGTRPQPAEGLIDEWRGALDEITQ